MTKIFHSFQVIVTILLKFENFVTDLINYVHVFHCFMIYWIDLLRQFMWVNLIFLNLPSFFFIFKLFF